MTTPESALRIGLILYGGLDGLSGGYLYDRMMVEGLRRRGAGVEVLSLPWRNYGRHLADNFSVPLIRLIRRKKWDVLLQDELNHPSLFRINRLLKQTSKRPIFSIVHHLRCSEFRHPLLNRFYRAVERRYLRTADGLICNSRTTVSEAGALIGETLPYRVVYPGKDHIRPEFSEENFSQKMREGGPLRILFLGNVIPRKGLHVLMESLSGLPGHAWHLTVAGDPAPDPGYSRKILKQVESRRLGGSVTFSVRPDGAEVIELFRAHHCLVMPSFYEGFGIACLEAMGFGLPVIASKAGAGPEWIRDGEEGFLVPPGESGTLAERIGRWIRNREELHRMGQCARRTWEAHPTWEEGAAEIYEFIRSRCPAQA